MKLLLARPKRSFTGAIITQHFYWSLAELQHFLEYVRGKCKVSLLKIMIPSKYSNITIYNRNFPKPCVDMSIVDFNEDKCLLMEKNDNLPLRPYLVYVWWFWWWQLCKHIKNKLFICTNYTFFIDCFLGNVKVKPNTQTVSTLHTLHTHTQAGREGGENQPAQARLECTAVQ